MESHLKCHTSGVKAKTGKCWKELHENEENSSNISNSVPPVPSNVNDKIAKIKNQFKFNPDSNKPYECNFCQKTFVKKMLVRQHLVQHSAIKPYNCHVCDKGFNYKQSMEFHMKTHANQGQTIDTSMSEPAPPPARYLQHSSTAKCPADPTSAQALQLEL